MCKPSENFKETLIPTEFPERPWRKVGPDIFQWKEDQYLLVIDYFVEIAKLSSTTATCAVTHLKSMFAHHGIPTEVMSDNGPQFSAEYFRKFTGVSFTQRPVPDIRKLMVKLKGQ